MKVLILDDDTDRAKGWMVNFEGNEGVEAHVKEKDEVKEIISGLHETRLESRSDGGGYSPFESFSGYDLLIVDYDLLGLDEGARSAWSTGAEVAYAARLMADIGPILVVNQYGTNPFDLTMKRTIPSYADYDFGNKQIVDPGLWKSSGFDGFRPWHWPNLNDEPSRFNRMRDFVLKNIDESIVDVFGFDVSDVSSSKFLSRDISGYLGLDSGGKTTFRELISVRRDMRIFNILEKDIPIIKKMPVEQLARLASVVVWQWLEKVVLPNQELIADLPHIASKSPWIMNSPHQEDSWCALCKLNSVDGVSDILEQFAFLHGCFFSRPVYWGERVRVEVDVPSGFNVVGIPDLVFCEDTSSFVSIESARSYPSDLFCFDKERWVVGDLKCGGENVNYEPQSYLLM